MRSYPCLRPPRPSPWLVSARSRGAHRGPRASPRRRQPRRRPPRPPRKRTPPAPGAVEVSPGGVTTAVGAPAESTEEEYFQACQAAKAWMDQQGGDPKSQIEPYLGTPAGLGLGRPGHVRHAVVAAGTGAPGRRHRRGPGRGRRAVRLAHANLNHGCEKLRRRRHACTMAAWPASESRSPSAAEVRAGTPTSA